MATYTIQAPDGNKYSVQGPDNASQEDVQAEVLRQHPDSGAAAQQAGSAATKATNYTTADGSMHTAMSGQQIPAGATVNGQQNATDGMSTTDKTLAGAGKAFVDVGRGAKQLLSNDKPANLSDLVSGTTGAQRSQAEIDEARRLDKDLMNTHAGQAGEMLGNMAMMLATPGGFLGAAATGAAQGALIPTGTGESRAANVGIGALLGSTGQIAGKLLGKVVGGVVQPFRSEMSAAEAAGAKTLTDAGVPLNAAQQGGGKVAQTLTNIVGDNPFVGSTLGVEQKKAFTSAALRTVGVDSETADATIMARIKSKIGDIFDKTAAKYPIPLDDGLMTKLATITSAAGSELGPNEMAIINKQINNIVDHAAAGDGTMTGEAFQNARSSLARLQGQKNVTGHWAGEVHDALTEALGRYASPEDNALINKARTQWKALKQIEPSIDGQDYVNPKMLYNSLDRQRYSNQMIYGDGDQSLVQLATAGKNILGGTTPNSGTAQRVAGMLALGTSLSAIDMLARGDPSEAMKVGLLGIAGPNLAKMVVENPRSARLVAQWARSKVTANFRTIVDKAGSKMGALAGGSLVPSMGGTKVQAGGDSTDTGEDNGIQ